jgi:hypothetical protein
VLQALRKKPVWLPVGLLIGVAVFHAYRVEVFDLTPWKGGGFGMFSTLDGRDNRRLIVELVNRRGEKQTEVRVDLPRTGSLRKLADKAQAMPTEERVRALAEEVAKQPWRVAEAREGEGENWARITRDRLKQKGTRPVAFDAVEVRVWKLSFERKDGKTLANPDVLRTAYVTKEELKNSMRGPR